MADLQKLFKKYRFEILAFCALTVLYFSLRLYNIMSLPIFTDEAIYVRWSQIARFDSSWRFISLTDGKQPLFVWFALNVMRLVEDPLLASRLVSVAAGFSTMVGLFFLGREIFKNRFVGLISSFLYALYPFALVYDRMALYESLVGVFTVWALYFEVLLARRLRLDIALILSMVLGAGILTKTSAFFNIYLIPTTLLLFDFKNKNKKPILFRWALLVIISVVLAYAYYSVLKLSPFFHIINEKNTIFVYSFKDWLTHPFNFLSGNLMGLWDWFITYMSWPVFLLIIMSFFVGLKFTKEKILLVIWFVAPFMALALFGRVLYPRFIFFMTLPLLPLAAFSLSVIYEKVKSKYLIALIFAAFLITFARSDFYILSDFAKAPIARPDLDQYINEWPAGGGIIETIDYLSTESEKGKIYVASLGTFGSLPTYSVEIYLGDNRNVDKRGIYPVPSEIPKDLIEKAKKMPTYLLVSSQSEFEEQIKTWPLALLLEVRKGTRNSFTRLYRIKAS